MSIGAVPHSNLCFDIFSAVYNVSNISMGLGVNPLSAVSQALNGFVASASATSVAVSSVSPITSMNSSGFCSDGPAYFEESSPQFNTLTQQQSDFDGRSTAVGRQQLTTVDSDVGRDPLGVGRSPASSRVQLDPDLRDLEASIRRRTVQDHPFNQTVNNRECRVHEPCYASVRRPPGRSSVLGMTISIRPASFVPVTSPSRSLSAHSISRHDGQYVGYDRRYKYDDKQ